MNIFKKWITGRAGKMALSAAQAVGLSAVVGVAGIAAWQYLDAPADNNTAFNLAGQYDPGEVVYVAGASGGAYGANGEVQSAFRAKASKAIEMTEKMTLAQKQAEDFDDSVTLPSSVAPSDPQAYQMGGTEGLGMGGNRANEQDLKNNPMALMQQSMAGVSEAVNRAQAQAQGQAAAATGQAPGEAPAGTLASANRDWGASAATKGISGGGGNSFNSSFSVQDSGKNSKEAAAILKDPDAVMRNFQAQAAAAREGAQMRARSAFGKDEMLASDRETAVGNGRSSKEGKDLEFIRKRSVDAAKNRNRSANEGARAFLASTRISGGMTVVGDNVTTGQGQGSKDFEASTEANLRGLKTWNVEVEDQANKRDKSQKNIRMWMWIALPVALAAMPWIAAMSTLAAVLCSNPFTLAAGVALWIKAAALLLVALAPVMTLLGVSVHHMNNYGGEALSTWGATIAGILTAGLGTCMIPGVGAALGVLSWNAILATVGGVALGAGAAALLNGTVKPDPGIDPESLNNPNNK